MSTLDLWASVIHHRVYGGVVRFPSAAECLDILREEPQYLKVDKIVDRSDELYDCTIDKDERAKRLQIAFDPDMRKRLLELETFLVAMSAKRGSIALLLHCHPTTGRYQPAAVGRAIVLKEIFGEKYGVSPNLVQLGDGNIFRSFRPTFWFRDMWFNEQRMAETVKHLCKLGRRPPKTEQIERLMDQWLNLKYREIVESLSMRFTHGAMPSDINRLIRMRQK